MRGLPLLRTALAFFVLALLGVPVWLTTRDQPRPETVPAMPAATSQLMVDLEFTASQPATLQLLLADQKLWEITIPTTAASQTVQIPSPLPVDLIVRSTWPTASSSQAIRLRISHDGDVLSDQTYWGEKQVEDILTVKGFTP